MESVVYGQQGIYELTRWFINIPNPGNGPEIHGHNGIKTVWSHSTELEVGERATCTGWGVRSGSLAND